MVDSSEDRYNFSMQKKRLDQYKSFFSPTLADNQEDFYSLLRPCLGYELSTANIDKEDMPSYILQVRTAQEMCSNGQIGLTLYIETTMTAELKLTDSVEARVIDNIFSNRMEYTQTQNVHEYTHSVPKKHGLLGVFGRKPPAEEE